MPSADELRRILAVATSGDEVAYVYDQLTSADWIPALREIGAFNEPPEPIERGEGVMFPGWAVSSYLVRVASQAPAAVAEVLRDIVGSLNPRVWWDIVRALVEMPAAYAVPFLPEIARWIHSPFRLGVDTDAAKLSQMLADDGLIGPAMDLLRSLAMLAAPTDWSVDQPWLPLDGYNFKSEIPPLVAALLPSTSEVVSMLADELERAGNVSGDDRRATNFSSIWRPAIEDHEQNWEHDDRLDTLVVVIRDSALRRISDHPDELQPIVEGLMARDARLLKRIAIHLLVERGDLDLDLVGSVLTNGHLFADTEFHHEFYRLAQTRFHELPVQQQQRYVELVDQVAAEKTAGDSEADADRRKTWWAWNRLGAVAGDLKGAATERYEAIAAELGQEEHPDLLSYHSSWMGPTSPLSKAELDQLSLDELIAYLQSWTPERAFGPVPSREGLARELGNAATAEPARYVPIATRLIHLPATYASWFLLGLRDALRADKSFDLDPAIELCHLAVLRTETVAAPAPDGPGDEETWAAARLDVSRFLETALEDRPGELAIGHDGGVWETIAMLLSDPDPTPELESHFGPPNSDALTYSLNSTRPHAVHTALTYCLWSRRHAASPDSWRLSAELPEASRDLEAHMSADRDPSIAVAAAFGSWLSRLIVMDPDWIGARLDVLLGDLAGQREQAAWDAHLLSSGPDSRNYQALKEFYGKFARNLSGRDSPPADAMSFADPITRFIDHVVVLAVWGELPAETGPLAVMLEARRPWLIKAIAEEAGRVVHNTTDLDAQIAEAFHALWDRFRQAAEESGSASVRAALAGFSWWFASSLSAEWTLPELVRLLEAGVTVDPAFLVLPKLAEVAPSNPGLAMRALEQMAPSTDDEWTFRAREKDVREVLEVALDSDDTTLAVRAEALVNRFGRLGMLGLGSLLKSRRLE